MSAPNLPSAYTLVQLDSVDSTSAEARRLAATGEAEAPDGTLVWALEQTAGRGRRGRTWESPRGNLYFSLILRPEVPLPRAAQLSFLAALAVYDAIGSLAPPGLAMTTKWPNDVLIGGSKVAGILLEAEGGGIDSPPDFVILGIGINLTRFPEDAAFPATCLSEEGCFLQPHEMLEPFGRHFLAWTRLWLDEGFERIRKNWLWRCDGIDKPVEVRLGDETLVGAFRDLDESGALVLETADGETRLIAAGDVFFPVSG